MKTAEDWAGSLGCSEEYTAMWYTHLLNHIKQIQLDAWKQGMTDAQTKVMALKNPYNPNWCDDSANKHYGVSWMREKCSVAITEAREDRKEI